MENDMYTNAQLIRKLREDRAWSQEHLAAVAGLSARTIQRVEADNSASRETRMAIAAALGIELAQLNRATEGETVDAPAVPATAVPVDPKRMTQIERLVWGYVLAFTLLVPVLYTLGKEMAERDNANSKCVVTPLQCPGR